MNKALKMLLPFVYGIIFGVANVIPGVSGGTMMVVFGCYDIICGAMALDIKEIKKNFRFLMFFFAGAAVGILGFSFAVTYLFENHPIPTFLFFMGLIAGSLPVIYRNLISRGKPEWHHIVFAVIAFAAVIILGVAQKNIEAADAERLISSAGEFHRIDFMLMVRLFICGFIGATAMIIPGLSGSFMLMLLGVYHIIIVSVTEFNLIILVPAGFGILAGIVFGARTIRFLLERFHTAVYSIIAGLVIGSMFAIFPSGAGFNLTLLAGTGAFILGGGLSLTIGKKNM